MPGAKRAMNSYDIGSIRGYLNSLDITGLDEYLSSTGLDLDTFVDPTRTFVERNRNYSVVGYAIKIQHFECLPTLIKHGAKVTIADLRKILTPKIRLDLIGYFLDSLINQALELSNPQDRHAFLIPEDVISQITNAKRVIGFTSEDIRQTVADLQKHNRTISSPSNPLQFFADVAHNSPKIPTGNSSAAILSSFIATSPRSSSAASTSSLPELDTVNTQETTTSKAGLTINLSLLSSSATTASAVAAATAPATLPAAALAEKRARLAAIRAEKTKLTVAIAAAEAAEREREKAKRLKIASSAKEYIQAAKDEAQSFRELDAIIKKLRDSHAELTQKNSALRAAVGEGMMATYRKNAPELFPSDFTPALNAHKTAFLQAKQHYSQSLPAIFGPVTEQAPATNNKNTPEFKNV